MRILKQKELTSRDLHDLQVRSSTDFSDIQGSVGAILKDVVENRDKAVRRLTLAWEGVNLPQFAVSEEEFDRAERQLGPDVQAAIGGAAESLLSFHRQQLPLPAEVETKQGVRCRLEWRAIESVGLYIPGGSAPLLSTVLMLGVPATLAVCPSVILCTPPRTDGSVSPGILYAAKSLGMKRVFKIGGAQAIAAMAVGTESVPKVRKIFGPGNRYVTAMKGQIANPPYSVAIDMLAGPSELLIIADASARAEWIAADLLSQAEHGVDSPVVLVTTSASLASEVDRSVATQMLSLPRRSIVERALQKCYVLVAETLDGAIDFSNSYAPEHLILAVRDAETYSSRITNAGSVFLGAMTSVVFGDYASGTNHTLPTGGTAVSTGGLTIGDFMKPIFFQTVDSQGLVSLSTTVKTLAREEGLEAHARAVEVREVAQ